MTASRRKTLLIVAGAALVVVAAFLFVRHRASKAQAQQAQDNTGRPGPDLAGSAAQQPNGGAASVPGNLPGFVSQPDALQQQVQSFNAASNESPQAIGNSYYTAPGDSLGYLQSPQAPSHDQSTNPGYGIIYNEQQPPRPAAPAPTPVAPLPPGTNPIFYFK